MIENLLLSVLIIAIAIAFIAIRVIAKPDGKMASMHIHDSKAMKERGIHCVMDQDREDRERAKRTSRNLKGLKAQQTDRE